MILTIKQLHLELRFIFFNYFALYPNFFDTKIIFYYLFSRKPPYFYSFCLLINL
jgi:hypothetical protein